MNNLIKKAIENKNLISFEYNGKIRIGEPHILGILNNKEQLLLWQISGESNSGFLPNWRRCDITNIFNLNILPETFVNIREQGRGASFDTIYALIED